MEWIRTADAAELLGITPLAFRRFARSIGWEGSPAEPEKRPGIAGFAWDGSIVRAMAAVSPKDADGRYRPLETRYRVAMAEGRA